MKRFVWLAFAVPAFLVAVVSWRYIFFSETIIEAGWEAHLANYPLATYMHFGLGPVALVLGIVQFRTSLRIARPGLHRFIGYSYVTCCLCAGVASIPIATYTSVGIMGTLGFWGLAVLWVGATLIALAFAVKGNIQRHERWMLRSYALTYAAVTLRLMLAVSGVLDLPEGAAYLVISWASWLLNLMIIELFLHQQKKAPGYPGRLAEDG